jgi:hypothetical protein
MSAQLELSAALASPATLAARWAGTDLLARLRLAEQGWRELGLLMPCWLAEALSDVEEILAGIDADHARLVQLAVRVRRLRRLQRDLDAARRAHDQDALRELLQSSTSAAAGVDELLQQIGATP